MALDHRRLIRPGKQIRPGFLRSTSLLFKILPPVHLYITSEVKQYYEALFLSYRPRTDCMMWCDDRSMSGLLAKSIKKFSSHLYGQPVLTFALRDVVESVWMNINRVTLQHNKEVIVFIFYLMVFSMCNLQKHLIRAAFWVLLQAMFHWRTENKRHSD